MKTLFYFGNKSPLNCLHVFNRIAILRKLETNVQGQFLLMKNHFKTFVETYHKKNFQERDDEHDSIIFPDRFFLEAKL